MLRLFTALSIPDSIARRANFLAGGVPGAHWHGPEDYHITLTFLGDADEGMAQDINEALADIRAPAFDLKISGAGVFEKGDYPTALWLGVAQSDPLHHLKQKIDRALDSAHVPFEKRKYTPHMTLAYLKNADKLKVAEFIVAHNLFVSEEFRVNAFHLYNSTKTQSGNRYEILQSYPLI